MQEICVGMNESQGNPTLISATVFGLLLVIVRNDSPQDFVLVPQHHCVYACHRLKHSGDTVSACELAGFDLSDVNAFVYIRYSLRAKYRQSK